METITYQILPNGRFPGVTTLAVTPDVPGYVVVEFVGMDLRVSVLEQDVLGQLGLESAP